MSDCSKIHYPSRGAAIRAMRAITRRYRDRARVCEAGAYFCSLCRGWHLTSKSGTQAPPWARGR